MVVSIIALLVGILLPAIGKAREQAQLTKSQGNMKQIGTAVQSYAAEFADRQLTMCNDNLALYGASGGGAACMTNYFTANGGTQGASCDISTLFLPDSGTSDQNIRSRMSAWDSTRMPAFDIFSSCIFKIERNESIWRLMCSIIWWTAFTLISPF